MAPLIVIQVTALMALLLMFGLSMCSMIAKRVSFIWYLITLMFVVAVMAQVLAIPSENYIFVSN